MTNANETNLSMADIMCWAVKSLFMKIIIDYCKKKKEILTQCYTYNRLYYSNGFGLFED
jgi:hypothetical protein